MSLAIHEYRNQLAALCRAFGVERLAVFGSASRNDLTPGSDVDLVVEFVEGHPMGAFDRYFGLKEALERLFQRPVDLVERKAIQNPYFRQAIAHDEVLVYGPEREKAAL